MFRLVVKVIDTLLLREGEESGKPIPWDAEAIKEKVRERVGKRR